MGIAMAGLLCSAQPASADIPLIGSNIPHPSELDGDFDTVMSGWRAFKQSPYWTSTAVKGGHKLGLAEGRLSSGGNPVARYESPVLDHNPNYTAVQVGDVFAWRFAAKAEYPCDGRVSFALVFGDAARTLADQVPVPTGPVEYQVFEGTYTVTTDEAARGMPFARFTLQSDHDINVYLDWVDLKVLRDETAGPRTLNVDTATEGAVLNWSAGSMTDRFTVYRSEQPRKGFKRIADRIQGASWTDSSTVNGLTYYYAVTRRGEKESAASPVARFRQMDDVPPAAPYSVHAVGEDWVVHLTWKTDDEDVASYNILRRDANGRRVSRIASGVRRDSFDDMLPVKGVVNRYAVEAVDYSGNVSAVSEWAAASVKAVPGASFSDLILPMPIHRELRSDLWGADRVLPRDPDNGVEHPDWTYWGGKVVKDRVDGKYHILITRWPEGDRKGHWAWPHSTVAHVVSDNPTGPYTLKDAIAYTYMNGLGHNPNIIALNNGTYALYSLIDWKATILTSKTMNGPWTVEGEISVEHDGSEPNEYRYYRNLSGVQCEDGSILMVTKAGAMMHSTTGLLGPYQVLTGPIGDNATIPEQYRKSNYEDPTLWYDGVQYHMLINAFLDCRAIYLRSPDGVNWRYETGLAYTPNSTVYEDGTRNTWHKLERPNVLQDEYGRATHLSLAAIDVPKDDDYGNDNHSAKHIILPLTVHKRLTMLNEEPVNASTTEIRVLIHSEDGFDAQNDLDLASLRFGASEEVNFGRGSRLESTRPHQHGLVLRFDGAGNGMTEKNFAGKLIGRTPAGNLVVGYAKLPRVQNF